MNQAFKRRLTLAVLTIVLWISGCGAVSDTRTPAEGESDNNQATEEVTTVNSSGQDGQEGSWEDVVKVAKEEGKLVIMTHPGQKEQKWVEEFQKAYPDIKVEHTGARPSDFSPRVISEQENGKYLWDVMVAATSNMVDVLTPAGAFTDIRPFFPDTESIDDSYWNNGGFEFYAQNASGQSITLIHGMDLYRGIYVNRDMLPKEQFSQLDDLMDPSLKGQILIDDPSVPAHGSLALTGILNAKGEEFLTKLLVDQEPVFVDDVVVATNWVAEGRYPIAIGADEARLDILKESGVGLNVEEFQFSGQTVLGRGASVFKNSPHPNAVKVFLDWFWSVDGQTVYSNAVESNSRRNDVPAYDPSVMPDWENIEQYSQQGTEKGSQLMKDVRTLYDSIN